MIKSVRIFPELQVATNSIGDVIEGSNDNVTFTTLHTLEDNLMENWNTFPVPDG